MTREEAKQMFRDDKNSQGCYKAVLTKIDKIYDEFEKVLDNKPKLSKEEQLIADVIGEKQVRQILRDNRCNFHHHKWGKKYNNVTIQFITVDLHGDNVSYCDIKYDFLTKRWSAFGDCIDIGSDDSDRPEPIYTFNDIAFEFNKIEHYWSREGNKPIIIK